MGESVKEFMLMGNINSNVITISFLQYHEALAAKTIGYKLKTGRHSHENGGSLVTCFPNFVKKLEQIA